MRYSIDDLVRLQYAANRINVASLLLQGMECSLAENENLIRNCNNDIASGKEVINEILNKPE